VADHPEHARLAQLTADIVAAYVSHNQIAPTDVARLVTLVAGELNKAGTEAETPPEDKPEPAVSPRRSVRQDHLVCLVCGRRQKMLKRHLAVAHDLSPAAYRERFGLRPDYPMAAPNYTQQRRELALEMGLGQPRQAARRRRKGGPRANTAAG